MSAQTLSAQTVALPVPPSAPPSVSPLRTPQAGYALKFTVAEYFALERASEIRYEYVEGDLIPMPGVTLPHNQISGNFYIAFDRAFGDRACAVYIEAVRVRVSPTQYRYPDVVAICGEPETDGEKPPALLNPSVIVEVLSASTEATDKREKFEQYRRMPSLTDYILAAQDRVAVTHYARQGPNQWTLTDYAALTDTLTFAALDATLSLAAIYRKVEIAAKAEIVAPAKPTRTGKRKASGK